MTVKWFQLVGGSFWGMKGRAFSGAAEVRAGVVLSRLEAEVIAEFDGQRWLGQGGYERVALGLEYRSDKRGRPLRSVEQIGRLLSPGYSLVWPDLENASVEEIYDRFRPIVLEALELLGERKGLGKLPRIGEAGELTVVPLKPLIDDPAPYVAEPGDSFVITRDFPSDMDESDAPEILRKYEEDLEALLSVGAMENIIETETSLTAVRWMVQAPPTDG